MSLGIVESELEQAADGFGPTWDACLATSPVIDTASEIFAIRHREAARDGVCARRHFCKIAAFTTPNKIFVAPITGLVYGEVVKQIIIELAGVPVAFQDHRTAKGHRYTPPRQRSAMSLLRDKAEDAMAGAVPLDEPLVVSVSAYLPIPRSWSKRQQLRAISGERRPVGRPDMSNFIKLAEDALNGVVWRDDALIVSITATKLYSEFPRTVITVERLSAFKPLGSGC